MSEKDFTDSFATATEIDSLRIDVDDKADDEDITLLSEETHPYLSLCTPPDRAKSAKVVKQVRQMTKKSPKVRPSTAPSLESLCQSEHKYKCADDDDVSLTPSDLASTTFLSVGHQMRTPSLNKTTVKRRQVRQVTGTSFRGRVEFDLTESGSRLPLHPPLARPMTVNTRPMRNSDHDIDINSRSCDDFKYVGDNHTFDDVIDDESKKGNVSEVSNDYEKKSAETEVPSTVYAPSASATRFIDDDPENIKYSAGKKKDILSEADRTALRLGRLVLSTVLNQPEVSVPDAISRFFLDTWLAKNGSSVMKADGLSVSLMTNLQKAFTEHDPGVDAKASEAASHQKTVAAIACETLDTLIQAFGESNPVLYDIREALLPLIFMQPPDLVLPVKKFNPEHENMTNLSGERYLAVETWCEDSAVIVEQLRDKENELFEQVEKNNEVSKDLEGIYDDYEKLQHDSKNALSLMHQARAEAKLSDKNYKDLLVEFEKVTKLLHDEQSKLKIESDRYKQEKKVNTALNVKLSALNSKHDALTKEKKELSKNKVKLEGSIKLLNQNLASSQKSFQTAKKNLEITKEEARQIAANLSELKMSNKLRESYDYAILKDMQDFFISKTNDDKLMSNNVHDMLKGSDSVIINVLSAWKDELLDIIVCKNEQLRIAEEELKKSDDSKLIKMQKKYTKEIQELNAAHVKNVLELKQGHKAERSELENSLSEHRKDNLEMTLERNEMEAELQKIIRENNDMSIRFGDERDGYMCRIGTLTEQNSLMQERLSAFEEDHMLEISLHEAKLAMSGLDEKVHYLVKSIEDLSLDLECEKEKTAKYQAELDAMGAELLNANNLIAERENTIVGLEEEIEVLRKPSIKEALLTEEICELKLHNGTLERSISRLETELDSAEKGRLHWQREYDCNSMNHEDWLVSQRLLNLDYVENVKSKIDMLETELSNQRHETFCMSQRIISYENELMRQEDSVTRTHQTVASFKSDLRASEKRYDEALHVSTIQSEKILSLSKENYNLIRSNEDAQERNHEKEELAQMLFAEFESLQLRFASLSANCTDIRLTRLNSNSIVATDDKSAQTDDVRFGMDCVSTISTTKSSESKVISSGNQSTGKGIPTRSASSITSSNSAGTGKKPPASSRNSRQVVTKSHSTHGGRRKQRTRKAELSIPDGRSKSSTQEDNSVNSKHSISTSNSKSGQRSKEHSQPSVDKRRLVGPNTYENVNSVHSPGKRSAVGSTSSRFSDTPSATVLQNHNVNVQLPHVITTSATPSVRDEDLSEDDVELEYDSAKNKEGDDVSSSGYDDDSVSTDRSSKISRESKIVSQGDNGGRIPSMDATLDDSISSYPVTDQPRLENYDDELNQDAVVDEAIDETTENLKDIDNEYNKLFDVSVAYASSQDYIFDIIGLREKRSLERTSRLKVQAREAKALVKRLESAIWKLSKSYLKSNNRIVEQDELLQSIREDVAENRWIFELQDIDSIQQCPLRDAIEVGALLIQSAGISDDIEVIESAEVVMKEKGCAYGIKTLAEKLYEWRERYDRRMQQLCGERPYEALLRREDGTIDTDIDIEVYPSTKDKMYLLRKINKQLRQDLNEVQSRLYDEIAFLRETLKKKDNDLDVMMETVHTLKSEVNLLESTTAPLEQYKSIRTALCDVFEFITSLTMSSNATANLTVGSGHVRQKMQTLGANDDSNPVSVYGNPGMLWRKIQKKKKFQKGEVIKQGHKEPIPDLCVTQHQVSIQSAPQPTRTEQGSDEKLIQELSIACNDLAEKVLFSVDPSSSLQFQKSSSLLLNESGVDDETDGSNVQISPSLLEFSNTLNRNVNHHVEEIRKLKQRKANLLNDVNNADPTTQAERYYAAQRVFSAQKSESIQKWGNAFPDGSGSEFTQSIVRDGGKLTPRNVIHDPTLDSELPIIERKQLVSNEQDSMKVLFPPKSQFLSLYKTSTRESNIPLMTKRVMK